ncbi:MAG TPA: HAD hydrolase family protein, partial [Candidatus Sabulitectum sp.]|nr:HAD hydrolase family protein [Candidatus Sabulitectum sp.]
MKTTSIFATDLDGTLLRSDGSFARKDIRGLEELRRAGCAVILATGRSPFSLERCLAGRKLPV